MKTINKNQNAHISRNNRTELKNQLSYLATNAKKRLDQNQNLNELIKIKRKQISRNKENLSKFSSFNSQKINTKDLGNKIIKEIKSNNKELLSLNNYLHEQIKNLNNKYITMQNLFFKNNEILQNNLDVLKDRKFIYENVLQEKKFKIKKLTNNISEIYMQFYNNRAVDIFPDEQCLDTDEEYNKNLNIYKDLLFSKSLGFNKYNKTTTELKKKATELKNKIRNINKYINTLKNVNANFDCIDFSNYNSNKIYIEGEECLNDLNDKSDINTILIINTEEDSFLESSIIENDNLDSYDLISNSIFEEKTKIKLNLPLPKIDLSQINYNKKKMRLEDKEKSLSRNNSYSKKKESRRLNKLKNKIKANIEKKEIYIDTINKYKQKIKELKENVKRIHSPSIQSFKIKSVKKRTFLFNSTGMLPNNSLSIKNKIISPNGVENLNKDKNISPIKYYK